MDITKTNKSQNGKPSLLADLGDAQTFANEKALATERMFGFSVTNADAASQKIIITPSYDVSDSLRVIREGVIPYASGETNLTAAATGAKSIAHFLAFIAKHPTRVLYLQIDTTDTNQLNQSITIQQKSLFGDPQPKVLSLSAFKNPSNPNAKLLNVNLNNWQLDGDEEVSVIIPAGATTSFTFYFGASFNDGELLYKLGSAAQNQ